MVWETIVTIIALSLLPTLMLTNLIKQEWDKKKNLRKLKKENHSIKDFLDHSNS